MYVNEMNKASGMNSNTQKYSPLAALVGSVRASLMDSPR